MDAASNVGVWTDKIYMIDKSQGGGRGGGGMWWYHSGGSQTGGWQHDIILKTKCVLLPFRLL